MNAFSETFSATIVTQTNRRQLPENHGAKFWKKFPLEKCRFLFPGPCVVFLGLKVGVKNIISVVFLVELLFSVLEVDIVELTAKQSSTI